MYGVPADLPLKPFVGLEFNQIALGRFQVQFHCSGAGSISVEGEWEIHDAAGVVVDSREDHDKRQSFRLHKIIDVKIVGFEIDPPRSFTLLLENGYALRIFDDSPQYESFSIHRDGQASLYV